MINRTIIVTSANAPLARALAAALSAGGVGMFESALPPESDNPTHYISSGQIDAAFGPLLPLWTIAQDGTLQPPDQATKDAAVSALLEATGGMDTVAQLRDLVDMTVVVDCDIQTAEQTCARLGLL